MKIKKATTNLINKNDNKCFQYAATVASKSEPFTSKHNLGKSIRKR